MHSDPIADLLTRIRNAQLASHGVLTVSYSKIKENILRVMKKNDFISDYKVAKKGNHPFLDITLKEDGPKIVLKRVSSPGQRIYLKHSELKPVKSGLGIEIVSTSKGIMTNMEAKKQKLGGEVLCKIY